MAAIEDAWGNRYCQHHQKEYTSCSCCQRLICEGLTGGGVGYRDGRRVCNLCRVTAVDKNEQARPLMERAVFFLTTRGFAFPHLRLSVKLVYRPELIAHSEHHGSEPLGMIRTMIPKGGLRTHRYVEGISLLIGLSRYVMEGIAVHELGHAWLFLHGVDGLSLNVEEGFCNMLSYLYHEHLNTDESHFAMRMIEKNPDPVYGNGFREVQAAVRQYGLSSVGNYLRLHRTLPGFGRTG